jgi:hypothetical protein
LLLDSHALLRQELVLVSVSNQPAVSLGNLVVQEAVGAEEALLQDADIGLLAKILHPQLQDHKLEQLMKVLDVGLSCLGDAFVVPVQAQDDGVDLVDEVALQLLDWRGLDDLPQITSRI